MTMTMRWYEVRVRCNYIQSVPWYRRSRSKNLLHRPIWKVRCWLEIGIDESDKVHVTGANLFVQRFDPRVKSGIRNGTRVGVTAESTSFGNRDRSSPVCLTMSTTWVKINPRTNLATVASPAAGDELVVFFSLTRIIGRSYMAI